MSDTVVLHPQIVYVVVASLLLGLPFYWLSFLRRPAFLRPVATVLLIVGTLGTWIAVASGGEARGSADALREGAGAVVHHQELGTTARNIFTGVLVLEFLALALALRAGPAGASVLEVESGSVAAAGASTMRFAALTLRVIVGMAWALGALHLYETAQRGGDTASEREVAVEYLTEAGRRSA